MNNFIYSNTARLRYLLGRTLLFFLCKKFYGWKTIQLVIWYIKKAIKNNSVWCSTYAIEIFFCSFF